MAIMGVVIGVPAGLAATRLIRAQLFGVGTIDLPSLSIAIVVLTWKMSARLVKLDSGVWQSRATIDALLLEC